MDKDTDDNNEKDIEMFMSKFDQLVERYPFLKSEKEESIHIWLVIYKMTELKDGSFLRVTPNILLMKLKEE